MAKFKKDSLGDRMKTYEAVSRHHLTRRMPVIIRLDGKAFHTFTKGFKKPFDVILHNSMVNTMKYLCENIQGCALGYTQSDEITLILVDYQNIDSCAWFDNNIQKMVSVSASMATLAFNRYFSQAAEEYKQHWLNSPIPTEVDYGRKMKEYSDTLIRAAEKGALFDARVFNLPREEVINCLIWRQQDATRNSIQGAGQYYFSHKELQGKSCAEIQDMLFKEKGVNWSEDYATAFKRGCCCVKNHDFDEYGVDWGGGWQIDTEIPIFTQDRNYINKLVKYAEDIAE